LEAFTAFTEAAGVETDVLKLSHQAFQVLQGRFSDTSTAVFYEVEGELFYARSWSEDIDDQPELLAALQQGTSLSAPLFAEAVETGGAAFTPAWDPTREQIAHTEAYGAAAVYPLIVNGKTCALLGLGLRQNRNWTEQDEAVLRAVGRGLTLAMERAEVVKQLAQRQAALEQSNQSFQTANEELEAFSYSASHDLRTPVRHVIGFAELAQKALVNAHVDQAQRHLEIIKQGALRMTALIDGMLGLSRVGQQDLRSAPVELGDLVFQARRDVEAEFDGHPVRWQIADLPQVWGDREMLPQVMTNLLSNAVKYSSTRDVSDVRVWAQDDPAEWTIRVEDNGVGFDPRYAQKLFGIFQRLHNDRDFKGTGVGLATVRRIVTRHGGRVSAESAGQGGATFSFTLPKR